MTTVDLSKYDIEVLLDKSGSMSETDCPGGKSRWEYAQEQTEALAREAAKYDTDGITVVTFCQNAYTNAKVYENTTPDKVHQVFVENGPGGTTDTAGVLKLRTDAYFARKAAGNAKPVIFLVVTDGIPDSKDALEQVIVHAANTITADEDMGIQFAQIGQDHGARDFLKHLDDELQGHGAKFDIVDTLTMDEMADKTLQDILIEAVTD